MLNRHKKSIYKRNIKRDYYTYKTENLKLNIDIINIFRIKFISKLVAFMHKLAPNISESFPMP